MDKIQELDFDLVGLLLAPREFSYLKTFTSPIFDDNGMQLIELKAGLNVIFGRNGSGKTSLLRMMEAATAGQCSPFEGVVVRLSESFVKGELSTFERLAEVFDGKLPRNTPGIFLDDAWSLENSVSTLNEWAKERLALISPKYATSLFAEHTPAQPVNLAKGHHEYIYRSHGKLVELEVTPLIRLTEDTPFANHEIKSLQRLCLAVFGDSYGIKALEVQIEDKERVPMSVFANSRNFLGGGYGTKPNDDARFYFLDSLRMNFLTYPQTDDFQRERHSAPEPFISTIADGFKVENRGFALGQVSDLLKVIVSQEMKRDLGADLRDLFGHKTGKRPPKLLSKALSKISREFGKAFPIFSSAWAGEFSAKGLMMGADPFVSFQATGAEAEQLSESESRWFRLALSTITKAPSLLLLDEPERGLDRNALREVSRKLSSDWLPQTVILATSHSPSLLGISNSNAILIKDQKLVPYSRQELDNLAAYGIGPTDLVELHKAFIFVEGEHDKLILEHFFGQELEEISATLIPFRGTKNLPHMTNWSFFMRSTQCPLFLVVDNLNPEILMPAYVGAQQVFRDKGYNQAVSYLQRSINPDAKGSEEAAVVKVMAEAIQWAQPDRFIPTSLAKKDVLMYLPERIFGLDGSWDSLYERFQIERRGDENFKKWIWNSQKIDIQNPQEIARKLKSSDFPPHEDLEVLVSTIKARLISWQNSHNTLERT